IRETLGMVTQDGHLFHDTIRNNLLFVRPEATEDELWDALRRARLAALVESLPDGLETVVGERGYRLSGGERQRLTIARLLLARSRVVILDEATAALDSTSEAAVQEALAEALDGRTAVVIAARLAALVESLPDGLGTVVGERGYRLSGGERQRLTIARLLLARSRVVILDEATAALDSTSEAAVQEALAEALDGRTAVVIAHRL